MENFKLVPINQRAAGFAVNSGIERCLLQHLGTIGTKIRSYTMILQTPESTQPIFTLEGLCGGFQSWPLSSGDSSRERGGTVCSATSPESASGDGVFFGRGSVMVWDGTSLLLENTFGCKMCAERFLRFCNPVFLSTVISFRPQLLIHSFIREVFRTLW